MPTTFLLTGTPGFSDLPTALSNYQYVLTMYVMQHIFPFQPIKKLQVEVYYEVWCPDSRRYIIDQALPAWEKFEAIVDLRWKPYGKASVGSMNYYYFLKCLSQS